jgi:hypothetical protein
MFDNVPLEPAERAWAVARRLPLIRRDGKLAFKHPCGVLESRGAERVCGDYAHRPASCRAFRCKVLSSYERGELGRDDALGLVRTARALVDKIEKRVGGATVYEPLTSKLAALTDALEQRDSPDVSLDVEALLDLGALRAATRAFHEPTPPKSPAEDVAALLAQARDPRTWERIFASAPDRILGAPLPVEESCLESAARDIAALGYARLGPVLTRDEASTFARLVTALVEAGWPPIFVFMHEAVWQIPGRLADWLQRALGPGHELLLASWAWHVMPGAGGWRPHRERTGLTVQEDGTLESLTVWIALTDATPDNGCIYVLPKAEDPYYGCLGAQASIDTLDVQGVRALPAAAGTALTWDHQIVHWGGRSGAHASSPRVSLAFEFRRAGTLIGPKVAPRGQVPTFDERLVCVGDQIARYMRFGGIDERFCRLADELSRAP